MVLQQISQHSHHPVTACILFQGGPFGLAEGVLRFHHIFIIPKFWCLRRIGWVGFIGVCFLCKINRNPRYIIGCRKTRPGWVFYPLFCLVVFAFGCGVRRYIITFIYFPTEQNLVNSASLRTGWERLESTRFGKPISNNYLCAYRKILLHSCRFQPLRGSYDTTLGNRARALSHWAVC